MLELVVKFKAGVIQVLLLLLALSVIAASSVSIMAQQKRTVNLSQNAQTIRSASCGNTG